MASNEVYSFALKNALNEIQNICPDIKNSFMFMEDGEVIAADEKTPEKTIVRFIDSFDCVLEKAATIGGIESVHLEGSEGRINISRINDLHLVTVTTRKADMNYVNTVTRVLIPTVLRLLEKTYSAPLKSKNPLPEIESEKPLVKPVTETPMEEPKENPQPKIEPKSVSLEIPANQLIVENIGGLLVASDTVRIDSDTLSEWEKTFEGKKIEEVEIETFDGKTIRSKVKPIKDSKYYGKGLVQMPEKIQLTLEIRKGELIRVKPIIA